MMNNGWTSAQVTSLRGLLNSHHTMKITLRLLDLSHNYQQDLSSTFFGGQVTVDTTQAIKRAMDITLIDPLKSIHLDPESASPNAVYFTNMLSVIYTVSSPSGALSFDIPTFCGPVDKVERDGVFLDIKCVGKESLAMSNMWRGKTYGKNSIKTNVMKHICRTILGEFKYSIPNLPYRATNGVSISREQSPWKVLTSLAASMGYVLFYDGRGVLVMRKQPKIAFHTFDQTNITARPQVGYDQSTASNAVELIGGTPKGSKKRVTYAKAAPSAHPLNPWRVGRNGVPRYLNPILINNSAVKTRSEAVRIVNNTLNSALLESVEATFDAYAMPIMEEYDIYNMKSPQYVVAARARKFTVPLVANDDSTIGYLRRVTPKGRRPITRRKK